MIGRFTCCFLTSIATHLGWDLAIYIDIFLIAGFPTDSQLYQNLFLLWHLAFVHRPYHCCEQNIRASLREQEKGKRKRETVRESISVAEGNGQSEKVSKTKRKLVDISSQS